MNTPLSQGTEWNFELLQAYDAAIAKSAAKYGLDTYPNQIEVISSHQMLDAYSTAGMPLGYHHWSYGKQFVNAEKAYRQGHMNLAYEIVINSNPCIAYLMEENSIAMQALVIAHACYGHNSFFKGNYLFQQWTSADAIIDYLIFARNYIAECEQQYGIDAVESLLDACHALMPYGIDRYQHPAPLSLHEEKLRQHSREQYLQSHINELWRTIPERLKHEKSADKFNFPSEPQENLLYFIEKHAPHLQSWQREVIRIVRKTAQYFYPQRQTKVMNEGWACFWHYTILHDLYDSGLVSDSFMVEFLEIHTNVLQQPAFNSPHFAGINPYVLGFNIFLDIKRICTNPTAEDLKWFPELAQADWLSAAQFAMRNFKDESFIAQYLSPHVIRNMRLFTLQNDDQKSEYVVTAIHDEEGYHHIRQQLAKQFDIGTNEPTIVVHHVNVQGDRALTLHYQQQDRRPLSTDTATMLEYVAQLWGFPVHLECYANDGSLLNTESYPARPATIASVPIVTDKN